MNSKARDVYEVIIFGAGPAGPAGLTARLELVEKNLKVCVLEAAPFLNGNLIFGFAVPFNSQPLSELANEI